MQISLFDIQNLKNPHAVCGQVKPIVRRVGETVPVELPDGVYIGKIKKIFPKYGFSKELKYEIHGKDFVTITSERTIVAA